MAGDDFLCQTCRHGMRSIAFVEKHGVIIVLSTLFILVPPHPQRRGIVAGDGTDRTIRIMRQVAEANTSVFRHRLKFEGKDAQLIHHPLNTIGHHAQVFSADEHTGSLHKTRQFLHGLPIPEMIVPTIEIIIIEAVEGIFIVVTK